MHLTLYPYIIDKNFRIYEFVSEGPAGMIRKIVRFDRIGPDIYNLSLGDLDEKTGKINYSIVSDNKDRQKILATVAVIVHDFTMKYPQAWIFARGRNKARNRLYRMGINSCLVFLEAEFDLYGIINDKIEPFTSDQAYDSFLAKRKKN